MKYVLVAGGAIFITTIIITVRRRNALLRYLQKKNLNDYTNTTEEDKYIYSM